MDWENNCMTGMMVNFLFLRLHTHHHHPACGGDVLVLCAENHKQHAFCKQFQLMCYQAYVCLITAICCQSNSCTTLSTQQLISTHYSLQTHSPNCKKSLLASSRLNVRPHRTTWLPLDRFSLNLKFKTFENLLRKFKFD